MAGIWDRVAKFARGKDAQVNPNATDVAPVRPPADPGSPTVAQPLMRQQLAISQESAIANRFELLQYNPDELFTKRGVRLLEKMAVSDETISACLMALKMMSTASGFQIEAASESPMDEAIADEVAENLENLEGSLREKMFSILGSLDLGQSIHEKVWDYWGEGSPYAGHVRLMTLSAKNPRWFNPSVDDFNKITGLVMISPPAYGRKLPARKFLIYSMQKRYENVWGTARQRALYDWWYLKGLAKTAIAVQLKKYGKETPIGFVPDNMSAADKTTFLATLAALADQAAVTVPVGVQIEFAKFDPNNMKSCLEVIAAADQAMRMTMLGQVMSSGTSSAQPGKTGLGSGASGHGGGKGAGQLQEMTLNLFLQYIQGDVSENPLAEVIKEIVDYNHQGVYAYPKLKFNPLSEEDQQSAVTTFIQAATAQVGGTPDGPPGANGKPGKPGKPGKGLVTPGPDDEEWIRKALGAPSQSGDASLRPGRKNLRAKLRIMKPLAPIDPRTFPIAGYRPPTPSAPGLPANYSESSEWTGPKRTLTKFEKGVDFAESWDILDTNGEDKIASKAAAVIRKAVDKVKLQAKDAIGDSGKIKKMTLPYRSELASVLRDGAQDVAKRAMKQARAEIAAKQGKKLAEIHDLEGMAPEEVLKLIDDQSFTMGQSISDDVLRRIKQAMYNGVRAGKSYKDIVYDIENIVAPYIDLTAADEELSGARLSTAVRTFISGAYNDARRSIFEDPALDGFTLAYQFSAIMDGDTTSWCSAMDERVFKVTNPIWDEWMPPTYFNCRSVLIPITKVDEWDGEESEPPSEEPPAGFH